MCGFTPVDSTGAPRAAAVCDASSAAKAARVMTIRRSRNPQCAQHIFRRSAIYAANGEPPSPQARRPRMLPAAFAVAAGAATLMPGLGAGRLRSAILESMRRTSPSMTAAKRATETGLVRVNWVSWAGTGEIEGDQCDRMKDG